MAARQPTSADEELRASVNALRNASSLLNRSDSVQWFTEQVNDAVNAGDAERTEFAAERLSSRLELVRRLTRTADELDPHSLDRHELDRLWERTPKELVDEALSRGELRERRMVLQAKEAETNRRLARAAIGAAIVALFVPVFEKLLDGV